MSALEQAPTEFTAASLAGFRARGFDGEFAREMGAVPVHTRADLLAVAPEFDGEGNGAAVTPGTVFRWPGIDGRAVPQMKPDEPIDPGMKYVFPKGHHQPFAVIRKASTATTELVLIVEGTCQSLMAARYAAPGVLVLAVPGCTGWYPGADLLRRVVEKIGAPVVAIFDADAATNVQVFDAGMRLAETLAGATPSVRFARVPGGGTTGLDDHLADLPERERAAELARRIADAWPTPADERPFPDPTPLVPPRTVPAFPVEVLPPRIGGYVRELARFLQVPEDMVAMAALGIVAAALQGRLRVEGRAGWTEIITLYVLVVAETGERKTPTLNAVKSSLGKAETELRTAAELTITGKRAAAKTAKKKAEAAWRRASKEGAEESAWTEAEQREREMYAAEAAVPVVPKLVANDVTAEKVARLLRDQEGRLAVVTGEGSTLVGHMTGMYSGGGPVNRQVWLDAYSGADVIVDRVKDEGEVRVPAAAMSIVAMAQPSVLHSLTEDLTLHDLGAVARFCFCLPPSRVGYREIDPPEPRPAVADAFHGLIGALAPYFRGLPSPMTLTLTPEARASVSVQRGRVEADLRPGGRFGTAHKDWGSKADGLLLRLAGVLHMAEHGVAGTGYPVTADTVAAAVTLFDYCAEHAIAAVGQAGATEADRLALALGDKIAELVTSEKLAAEFSVKELFERVRGRAAFRKTSAVEDALDTLAGCGWVQTLPTPPRPENDRGGQPPSPRFRAHPTLAPEAMRGSAGSADRGCRVGESERTELYRGSRSFTTTSSHSSAESDVADRSDSPTPHPRSAEPAEPTGATITPLPRRSPSPAVTPPSPDPDAVLADLLARL